MKILFAVSNEKIATAIKKQYQENYKGVLTTKNGVKSDAEIFIKCANEFLMFSPTPFSPVFRRKKERFFT